MAGRNSSANVATTGQWRCAGCKSALGEKAKFALGKLYHFDCFVCVSCSTQMIRYMVRDEKPYCVSCIRSMFDPRCAECGHLILGSKSDGKAPVFALGTLHHYACFVCAECEEPITGNFYLSDVDEAYCSKHPPDGTTEEVKEQCNAPSSFNDQAVEPEN